MAKLLVLMALAGLLIYWWRSRRPRGAVPPPRVRGAERMVVCAHCGVNVPESESERVGGQFYCTPEHRRRDHPQDPAGS
ncbi:PP0621 family protein [Rhodocyclus gracilis]|uniref:Preprotein translocase subunit YajC n=1 Tax=Rhodocyclus tenuis TaxID=1066 RepID=A0A6L5JUA2_RHOTE|nr:PP0621 family protein [Rhodocyclus gracilis]MQY50631.1 hypothetical protein [Rhodocyclus gracilis]